MHAILVSFGTDGDVFPFIALGRRLKARGHRVTLAANEVYGDHANRCGFDFASLVSKADTRLLLENPDLWHPLRSALAGARWARASMAHQHAVIASLVNQPDTVLVAYPPVCAARLAQVQFRRPLVSLIPMPWMILSHSAPPALGNVLAIPWLARPSVRRMLWRIAETANDLLLGREVNRIASRIGLQPVRHLYRWCLSPQRIIGLFPDWFAPSQPDWPTQIRLAGFALYDGHHDLSLPAVLVEFCSAGSPPIAITFGTGMLHGSKLFKTAIEACEQIGRRAVLLTRHSAQLPAPLPPTIRHCDYAPFSQLLPLCSAVIHHGGIGTTVQSMTAGLPQVILPMAWDQPDNAERVLRLGIGVAIPPNSNAAKLAQAIGHVLGANFVDRSRAIATRFGAEDPLESAATWVEAVADQPS